jgi:membrane protein implicated in regulation of membrane protease activity
VPAWVVWAIAAVALAIGEILTPGLFFLGPIAVAAVAAGVVAAVGLGLAIQVVAFIVGSLASLAILRPIARSHIQLPPELRTGTAALAGARAVVLERVDANGGVVKLAGETWSARAFFDEQVMEPGAHVEVVKIEGATALVQE